MFRRRSRHPEIYLLTDDVAIAPQPQERHWQKIRELGFEAVVDLREETDPIGPLVRSAGLSYMRAPLPEGTAPSVDELYEVTGWAAAHILDGGPVLVFCREARGRSAVVAVACLVKLGLPLSDAHTILIRTRPTAVINRKQMNALEAFANSLQATEAT